MTKTEILEMLSNAINEADENQLYGIGDKLFTVIDALKDEWGIED